MKLKAFLAVSLLAILPARACYCPEQLPYNLMLYRVMPGDISLYYKYNYTGPRSYNNGNVFEHENLELWRKQTGDSISMQEMKKLVYGTALLNRKRKDIPLEQDAIDYLRTAKAIENVREKLADPWYFPNSKKGAGKYSGMLVEQLDVCLGRLQGKYASRYTLLALRCYNALRRPTEGVTFWETQKKRMPHDIVYTLAEREAAASYRASGEKKKAREIYARLGDISSLRFVRPFDFDEMEYVYEHCPNSPYFVEEIQTILTHYDNHYGARTWSSLTEDDVVRRKKFIKLGKRALRENKVEDRALWYYAVAAMLDSENKPAEALQYVRQGERVCKSEWMKKHMRVLRMYCEARSSALNSQYEARLLDDLKWLCNWGKQEIKDYQTVGRDSSLVDINSYGHWPWTPYSIDALRRILLDGVCPRLLAQGKTTRALQLANFAEYWMFKTINSPSVVLEQKGKAGRRYFDLLLSAKTFAARVRA